MTIAFVFNFYNLTVSQSGYFCLQCNASARYNPLARLTFWYGGCHFHALEGIKIHQSKNADMYLLQPNMSFCSGGFRYLPLHQLTIGRGLQNIFHPSLLIDRLPIYCLAWQRYKSMDGGLFAPSPHKSAHIMLNFMRLLCQLEYSKCLKWKRPFTNVILTTTQDVCFPLPRPYLEVSLDEPVKLRNTNICARRTST